MGTEPVGEGMRAVSGGRRVGSTTRAAVILAFVPFLLPGLPREQESRVLGRHDSDVQTVAVTRDGSRVVSGDRYGNIRVWDLTTGELLRSWRGHNGQVPTVRITPDDQFVVSCAHDRSIKVWDLDSGDLVRTMTGHTDRIRRMALSPDGRYVATGSKDRTLRVWDLASGGQVGVWPVAGEEITGVAYTSDGTHIAITTWDGAVLVVDTRGDIKGRGTHEQSVMVACTHDGSRFVTASWSDGIKVWDLRKVEPILSIPEPKVEALAIASDDARFLSGGGGGDSPGVLKIWDLQTGEPIASLSGHTAGIREIALIPDESLAVTGAYDTTIRVWPVGGLLGSEPPQLTRDEQEPGDETGPPVHVAPPQVVQGGPFQIDPSRDYLLFRGQPQIGIMAVGDPESAEWISKPPEGEVVLDRNPTWCPDGSKFAFTRTWADPQAPGGWAKRQVWIHKLATDREWRLKARNEAGEIIDAQWAWDPAWSPGGGKIAYVHEPPPDQWPEIVIVDVHDPPKDEDEADALKTEFVPRKGAYSYSSPTWSPDGRQLAYIKQGQEGNTSRPNGEYSICIYNRNGEWERAIARARRKMLNLAWSPDGHTLAFDVAQEAGNQPRSYAVYAISAAKAPESEAQSIPRESWRKLISPTGGVPGNPAWSPDGKEMAFECWSADQNMSVIYRAQVGAPESDWQRMSAWFDPAWWGRGSIGPRIVLEPTHVRLAGWTDTVQYSGQVLDAEGAGIPNATVAIEDALAKVSTSVKTDGQGRFKYPEGGTGISPTRDTTSGVVSRFWVVDDNGAALCEETSVAVVGETFVLLPGDVTVRNDTNSPITLELEAHGPRVARVVGANMRMQLAPTDRQADFATVATLPPGEDWQVFGTLDDSPRSHIEPRSRVEAGMVVCGGHEFLPAHLKVCNDPNTGTFLLSARGGPKVVQVYHKKNGVRGLCAGVGGKLPWVSAGGSAVVCLGSDLEALVKVSYGLALKPDGLSYEPANTRVKLYLNRGYDYTVTGTIMDGISPVVGAMIEGVVEGMVVSQARSDIRGRYSLAFQHPGTYRLRYTHVGRFPEQGTMLGVGHYSQHDTVTFPAEPTSLSKDVAMPRRVGLDRGCITGCFTRWSPADTLTHRGPLSDCPVRIVGRDFDETEHTNADGWFEIWVPSAREYTVTVGAVPPVEAGPIAVEAASIHHVPVHDITGVVPAR